MGNIAADIFHQSPADAVEISRHFYFISRFTTGGDMRSAGRLASRPLRSGSTVSFLRAREVLDDDTALVIRGLRYVISEKKHG